MEGWMDGVTEWAEQTSDSSEFSLLPQPPKTQRTLFPVVSSRQDNATDANANNSPHLSSHTLNELIAHMF